MVNQPYKEELNDWDQTILAIGTFGNNKLKEDSNKSIDEEDSYSFQDCTKEFYFEEVGNFQYELNMNLEESCNFYPSNNLIYSTGTRECLEKTTPLFKDPLSTTESRMEKILRAILNKKIHPHGSCSTTFINKYLENDTIHQSNGENEDEEDDEEAKEGEDEDKLTTNVVDKGYKWVKTDSEYIVLEI
ncbi:hypothetical protein TSUD_374040 [Trifolium subterraneum]|uniref:Uncharacterized protein n=1 Tax=Trifolium subterraneum TaxID=3900 RepID=A0A2Z6NW55_TRISU|nr:hypothetical protein TSUD_374040 [Trifolium subterraneum]